MDAFFASVELVRRPELRGKPVLVGGAGERGVVAAASYEARVYGIHSAMSSVVALRLCPDAIFLPGDHAHYGEVSRRVMSIFRRFTPLVEPLSLDEAFLDVSGSVALLGSAVEQAAEIRRLVLLEEGLGCSVGIAPNKYLAKLASEQAKPRVGERGIEPGVGVLVVHPDEVEGFLGPLPVSAIWGVGPRTDERLQGLGVRTVGKLAEVPERTLEDLFGETVGRHLWQLSRGIDLRPVDPEQSVKSVSHEETFAEDRTSHGELRSDLLRQADAVAERLRAGGIAGRTVTIKVRFADFTTVTRSHTRADPTDVAAEIIETAENLLMTLDPSPGVRLLGVGVSSLQDSSVRQLRFEDLGTRTRRQAERTVDEIRKRFGRDVIGPGSTLSPAEGPRPDLGSRPWGPEGA
jgi:DNA polymerase-4